MKRSDLICKLGDRIAEWKMDQANPGRYDYLAEKLLEIVEQAGMKPPVTKKCPVLLRTEHTWEPEDA